MEAPSSSRARDCKRSVLASSASENTVELELEDLWPDLSALRKLYGLLERSPEERKEEEELDDKSRLFLKKLLDDATQQVLQCQAKILASCTMLLPSEKSEENHRLQVQKMERKPCSRRDRSELKRLKSDKSMRCSPTKKLQKTTEHGPPDHRRQIRRSCDPPRSTDRSLRARDSSGDLSCEARNRREGSRQRNCMEEPCQPVRRQGPAVKNGDLAPATAGAKLLLPPPSARGGDRSHKVATPPQITSKGETVNKMKAAENLKHKSWKPPNHSMSSSAIQTKQTKRRATVTQAPTAQKSEDAKCKEKIAAIELIQPIRKNTSSSRKPTKSIRSVIYSSSSTGDLSESTASFTSNSASSSNSEWNRRRGPSTRRSPASQSPRRQRRLLGDKPYRPDLIRLQKSESKKKGRLRNLKDKLSVIFHHHHHHHLHHGGAAARHRSPWDYLRSFVPHQPSQRERGKPTEGGVERRRRAQADSQSGYLRALVEGLVGHVRRRKAVRPDRAGLRENPNRVRSTQIHWWRRLGGRGGLKLASRKNPRIRLGTSRGPYK